MDRAKPFGYKLEPLLKKRQWELDALRAQFAEANTAREQRRGELRRLSETLGQLEEGLRVLLGRGAIDRERLTAQRRYAEYQRELRANKAREAERCDIACEQIMTRVESAKRAADGLERHKDRMRRQYEQVLGKRELIEADNAWLLRAPRKEG